jgi:threonylcarbamoyladenosine tRNA methylthiotransferase MtaB
VESEAIRQTVSALPGTRTAGAPTIIINTCAVTGEAVRQARQSIRRARRERPSARIIVTGCAAQIEPDTFATMDEVDAVIGNQGKASPALWVGLMAGLSDGLSASGPDKSQTIMLHSDIMAVRRNAPAFTASYAQHTRAFVEVQNGCDHRCTFCIIPFGRGPSRSVPMGQVVAHIARLVQKGYREVVLTGVDLTSYGPDLPGKSRLGHLVQAILRHVPDLPRLRLSSLDSVEVDEALIEAISSETRLMPHLHLSLQSGDDMILKRMKRRHSAAQAIAFCQAMRAARPDLVLGADIIAGFPTETDTMFDNSLKLMDECAINLVHVFPFSPRQGTPAARMPQLDRVVVKARAGALRTKARQRLTAHLKGQKGKILPVLVEGAPTTDGPPLAQGRTPGFGHVVFPLRGNGPARGQIVDVAITGHRGQRLTGQMIEADQTHG